MEQTRFERSENLVCVTKQVCEKAILVKSVSKLQLHGRQKSGNPLKKSYYSPFFGFLLCLCCNEDKIWSIYYRSLSTAHFLAFCCVFAAMKTKSGQCQLLGFSCVFNAMKTKSGQYIKEVLLQRIFWLFVVSSLQWRVMTKSGQCITKTLSFLFPALTSAL